MPLLATSTEPSLVRADLGISVRLSQVAVPTEPLTPAEPVHEHSSIAMPASGGSAEERLIPLPPESAQSSITVPLTGQGAGLSASPLRPPQCDVEFIPFTMPHISADIPPRPEFTPFTVPHLCASAPYDHLDFWTFPQRCGWIVHTADMVCHILCPPGICRESLKDDYAPPPGPPIFSHSDGRPVLATKKASFLQAWLFFGVLEEVSVLCGMEIDVKQEFVVAGGNSVSTEKLNGLPKRWFDALKKRDELGEKAVMERILSVARHARLMLTDEKTDLDRKRFEYTYAECRVFQSLDNVVRLVGLHLLSHLDLPWFEATTEEGWT